MNGRRAGKLRKMARAAVVISTISATGRPTQYALARLTEKLARALRKHWARLNHRQRGRFSSRDVEAALRGMR